MANNVCSAGYDVGAATIYSPQGPLKPPDLLALTCSKCKLILREPKQVIVCGHRYCKICIEQLTSGSDGPYSCCVDEEKFHSQEVRNDKGCLRDILGLEVDCPTQPDPCNWRGKLTDMEVHKETCPNKKFLCALGCGEYFQKDDLEAHMTSQCPKRPLPCQYCKNNFPLDSTEDHYEKCEECPVTCDYCHKDIPSRKNLTNQLKECDEYFMVCPLQDCLFKGPRLGQHILNTHLVDVMRWTQEQKKNQTFYKDVQGATSTAPFVRMKNECCNGGACVSHLNQEEETLQTQLEQMDRRVQDNKIQSATSTLRIRRDMQTELEHLKGKVDANQAQIVELDRMMQSMSKSIHFMQESLTRYAIAIDEVRLRQDLLDVKTTHGILVWNIPDIRRHYRDAVEHRTISLYSPPFYTSPHGYRMCIRTYFNGDGIGKGTHISVFFVLMRSEHDNLLSWPFKQSVRFTLINQKNPAASITEAFVPDLHSPSFKKPENDMNIASGFPKFARQSVLQDENFTQGNVIYIKCQVDLSGLPYL